MAVKLLVVGCGKMGNAILSGLFDKESRLKTWSLSNPANKPARR